MTLINLRFAPEMEDAILSGNKCCTTRTEKKGEPGDMFQVQDRLYRILHVHYSALYSVKMSYYEAEGFASSEAFQEFWEQYVGPFDESKTGYIHFFAYVTGY